MSKKYKVLLFSYGFAAEPAISSLINNERFEIVGSIVKDGEISTKQILKSNHVKTHILKNVGDLYPIINSSQPDICLISSFDKIIPQQLLSTSKFVNVHYALLPKYRGRAPLNWALINDEKYVGVTIHEAVTNLDAGNIYFQKKIKVEKSDTVATLYTKCNNVVRKNISSILAKILENKIKVKKQDENKATYGCTRLPKDGLIDWTQPAPKIYNLVRALTKPYPGAFTFNNSHRVIVWKAQVYKKTDKYVGRIPGRIEKIITDGSYKGVVVFAGKGCLLIQEIQVGKNTYEAQKYITSTKTTLHSHEYQF